MSTGNGSSRYTQQILVGIHTNVEEILQIRRVSFTDTANEYGKNE